ncbi:MAG: putative sensor protein [Frankiales bacterium]|nr:putative sensor protein [Frankiales bacterium]
MPAPRLTAVDDLPTGDDAALLSVLLDAAPVGFAHYDRDRRLLHINEALARANGGTVQEHLGRTVREVAPSLADQLEPLLDQVLATGEAVLGVEVTGVNGDGARSHWTTGWYPVRDPQTAARVGVAMVATDITTVVDAGESLRRTAMTLQRSLLPAELPSTEELEVAVRYVAGAADTEVGGDWYDVIALGAGRLALVIGDVMGRGVPAAAVMGQLRTAARTCARLDLRPGEVLDVLDGVLRDLDHDAIATCVYAVFDPHTRDLRLASAGHLPPLVRRPGGATSALRVDVGAPLGLADASRETTVQLQPGSTLALYTDGLVEVRGSDLEDGIHALCDVVASAPGDLEQLADRVMSQLAEHDGDDDVALLLIRVPEDVDARSRTVLVEVPRERALMFDVRSQARLAMRSWMLLDEVVDTATVVASELATNALVHGRGRVELRLRLTRDRLVLESVDSGHHMPRRRRAGDEDEGGRGLQLVAELADRWGFRATDEGKVVWAEIDLA